VKKAENRERVPLYLDRTDYRLLRSILALTGTSVSAWVREMIRATIEKRKGKA
jgi:hypothetical protein